MLLFIICLIAMIAATAVDGWSQHHMLYTNGGKGVEANTAIYGKLPSYWDYSKVNLPILAAWIAMVSVEYLHYHSNWHWTIAAMLVGWHIYGSILNFRYF